MSDTMTRQPAARGKGKEAPRPSRPFVAGTREIDEPDYDVTYTMTTSAQDLPNYEISPNGFLAGLFVLVECTTAGNAATVAFQADGPFSALSSINFADTNSQPIVGPMSGFDLYTLGKYGGYAFVDDAKESPIYAATAGAGATGGSFTYCLYVPIELVRRDGLGSLPNKSSSSTFKMDMTGAASTAVYSTPPTTLGTVRVRIVEVGWQDPSAADIKGNPVEQNPPAVQTTQYWSRQTYTVASGAMDQRLQGIDSLVRNLVFVLRDENGSRSQGDSEWPDPFTFQYETSLIVESRIRAYWRHLIARNWGYKAAVDTAGGRDSGVYPLTWARDFGLKVGGETRYSYLPVSSATNLTIRGTIGGSGANSLTVLVNKVVPAQGNPLLLTGGR